MEVMLVSLLASNPSNLFPEIRGRYSLYRWGATRGRCSGPPFGQAAAAAADRRARDAAVAAAVIVLLVAASVVLGKLELLDEHGPGVVHAVRLLLLLRRERVLCLLDPRRASGSPGRSGHLAR